MHSRAPTQSKAQSAILKLRTQIKRGEVRGSYEYVVEVVTVCRLIVKEGRWKNAQGLIQMIQEAGRLLQDAKPSELVIGNMVKRILFLVREEYTMSVDERQEEEERKLQELHDDFAIETFKMKRAASKILSLRESGMLRVLEEEFDDPLEEVHGHLKSALLEEIDTLMDQFPTYTKSVAQQALNHIHSDEVIMTFGYSRTVYKFLEEAGHSKRKIKVFVAESAPSYSGRVMAKELAEAGIDTTLISDAAVFAIMARINKVIIGTHAVMADGGLLAQCGAHVIAQAAKTYKVPVIVCTALYKLSPLFPSDLESLQELRSPAEILPFEQMIGPLADVEISNPSWDYIPPELVSLFITNQGSNIPSYVYRLLVELYNPKDT